MTTSGKLASENVVQNPQFRQGILDNRSMLTKAKDLGLSGLAEASDYLTGTAETLQDFGSGNKNLFTGPGAKEFAKAAAVPFSTGMGGVAEAYQRPAMREYEKLVADEEAQMEETTTANEQEQADLTMRYYREAGHDEDTIQNALELNGCLLYTSDAADE